MYTGRGGGSMFLSHNRREMHKHEKARQEEIEFCSNWRGGGWERAKKSICVNMHAEISQFRVNIMIWAIHQCGSSSQDFVKRVFFIFIIFLW